MPRGKGKKSNSMFFVFGVAIFLLILSYALPMRESLAQGINERTAVSWEGILNTTTNGQYYRMNYADGSYLQYAIHGLPLTLFTQKTSDGNLATALNLESVLVTAYREDPKGVEKTLGTYGNVPSPFHPFAEAPVAYSTRFLKVLSTERINPSQFGGPNIPPDSIHIDQLKSDQVVHIDTKPDGNTLFQCKPGHSPPNEQPM